MNRCTLAGLCLSATILAAGIIAVAAAHSGAVTFLTTHGTSMEPTYHSGDFVVIQRTNTYQTGDVAAYYDRPRNRVILHRIVDDRDDAFTLKGDNNPHVDPLLLREADLIGVAWLRVPKVGSLRASLTVPARQANSNDGGVD